MPPGEPNPDEVTDLLRAWREGDAAADDRLLERVYETLRNIALGQLRGERAGHTLEPTALVHEAYLRLLGQRELDWRDRGHFFGLASMTMRRILVDYARRRRAKKRGSGEVVTPLTVTVIGVEPGDPLYGRGHSAGGEPHDLLDLDRALDRFAERFPRQAKVVEMRYFAGLEFEDVAKALDLSLRTVKRDWSFARAWLRDALATP